MTIMSGDIASRLSAVSTSVSPLTTLEVAIGDVERVGAQPLLGDLERRPRPRARLEEQVDDRPAAQRRHLLDRPRADLLHRLGGVEHEHDLLGRQVRDAEQVPVLQACAPASSSGRVRRAGSLLAWMTTSSCRPPPRAAPARSRARRRHVLADVVRLDRQLAVSAIDQHDELNRLRPAEVDQRVERGANRPAGIEHVVHEQIMRSSIENGISVLRTSGCGPTACRIRSSR